MWSDLVTREIYLGVAFNFHDSAVAFVENDEVALVLEAERVFRNKKMAAGPIEMRELIHLGLRQLRASLIDVSCIGLVSFNNPWLEPDLAAKAYAQPVVTELEFEGRRVRAMVLSHRSPYLGRGDDISFTDPDIERAVEALAAGCLVLVHNGRSEVGPRALGHRSFLLRANDTALKRHVSEEIKGRAWFRPIAPIIRKEDIGRLCVGPAESPYMLFSYQAKPSAREVLGHGVHHDGTARVQTVGQDDDAYLRRLLDCYQDRTGAAVLLNTSLNRRGEPLADLIEHTVDIAATITWPHVVVQDGRCPPVRDALNGVQARPR